MNRKGILVGTLLVLYSLMAMAQSSEKSKYLGIYNRTDPFKTDTLSQTIFFTHDSFLLVFSIDNSYDYLHPIYRGTWSLNEETAEAELKFDNNAIKMAWFEMNDRTQSMHFYLDSQSFWQPRQMIMRKCKRRQ